MSADKQFLLTFKTDVKGLKEAYKALQDLTMMGNKVAKSFQGTPLGAGGGHGAKGAAAKALLEETKLMEGLGKAGEKMSKIFKDQVVRSQQDLVKSLKTSDTEIEKLLRHYDILERKLGRNKYKWRTAGLQSQRDDIVAQLGEKGIDRMGIQRMLGNLGEPGKMSMMDRFGASPLGMMLGMGGRGGGMLLGGMAGSVFGGGMMGMMGGAALGSLGTVGAVAGAAVLVAKKVYESIVREPEVSFRIQGATGQAYAANVLSGAQGNWGYAHSRMRMMSDPVMGMDARNSGFHAGLGAGASELTGYLNPLAWLSGENSARWREGAVGRSFDAAEKKRIAEKAEEWAAANPVETFVREDMFRKAEMRDRYMRKFGSQSYKDVTLMAGRHFVGEDADALRGAVEVMSQSIGQGAAGRGGMNLLKGISGMVNKGGDLNTFANIAARNVVGGSGGMAWLNHLDPVIAARLGGASNNFMGAGAQLANVDPATSMLVAGVGGGAYGTRQAEQNVAGTAAWGKLGGGFDPYSQTRNLINAVGAMPGASTYEQNYASTVMSDPKILARILQSGGKNLTEEMKAMGMTPESALAIAKDLSKGISDRFVADQPSQGRSSQRMKDVQDKFGGDFSKYIKSQKDPETAVTELAPILMGIAPELFPDRAAAQGFLRSGQALAPGTPGGGGGKGAAGVTPIDEVQVQVTKLRQSMLLQGTELDKLTGSFKDAGGKVKQLSDIQNDVIKATLIQLQRLRTGSDGTNLPN